MSLFSQSERTDLRYSQPNEPMAFYLERSARQEVAEIRAELESWYARFPHDPNDNFLGRFHSKIDNAHLGAFLELLAHELLLRLGLAVEVNPVLADKQPDFLVHHDSQQVYIECTTVSPRDHIVAHNPHYEDFIEKLKGACPRGLDIYVLQEGKLDSSISKQEIERAIRGVPHLDHPEALQKLVYSGGFEAVPKAHLQKNEWKAELQFYPSPLAQAGEVTGGDITSQFEAQRVDDVPPVRNAITNKTKKYSRILDAPLVVALNMRYPLPHNDMEKNVLLGTERWMIPRHGSPWRVVDLDGVWTQDQGQDIMRNQQLSAVWMFRQVTAFNFRERDTCLYISPWTSESRLPNTLMKLPHVTVEAVCQGSELTQFRFNDSEGLSIADLLG